LLWGGGGGGALVKPPPNYGKFPRGFVVCEGLPKGFAGTGLDGTKSSYYSTIFFFGWGGGGGGAVLELDERGFAEICGSPERGLAGLL